MEPETFSSMEELNATAMKRARVTGHGLEVAQWMPCPYCAHPDVMVMRPADMAFREPPYADAFECPACHRVFEIRVSKDGGTTTGTFVQTAGPDAPSWYVDPMPRGEKTVETSKLEPPA
jgi:hypothetical protein